MRNKGASFMPELRVYVSSTIDELAVERQAVREALENLGLIPVMFEDWAPTPKAVEAKILEEVRKSDIYLGIFWKNYSEPTVKEFYEARDNGKPTYIYVKDAKGPRMQKKLKEFIYGFMDGKSGLIFRKFKMLQNLNLLNCIT